MDGAICPRVPRAETYLQYLFHFLDGRYFIKREKEERTFLGENEAWRRREASGGRWRDVCTRNRRIAFEKRGNQGFIGFKQKMKSNGNTDLS